MMLPSVITCVAFWLIWKQNKIISLCQWVWGVWLLQVQAGSILPPEIVTTQLLCVFPSRQATKMSPDSSKWLVQLRKRRYYNVTILSQ